LGSIILSLNNNKNCLPGAIFVMRIILVKKIKVKFPALLKGFEMGCRV
jgi:hypothetical protein